jgi:hypothetical protein
MADTTITSANSQFTISVPGLFPVPITLEGYSADKAWSTNRVTLAETNMGVDGRLTSGYVPNPVVQSISLQADSPSKSVFLQIAAAMQQQKNSFYIQGNIDLPSTGETFIGTRGVLTEFVPLPDGGKVLQAMEFSIVWQTLQPALL